MPFVLSLLVLAAAGYCFWLFIQTATPTQMGGFLKFMAIAATIVFLLFLALSQRLPFALILIMAAWPVMAAMMDQRRQIIERRMQAHLRHLSTGPDIENQADVIEGKIIEEDNKNKGLKDEFNKSS